MAAFAAVDLTARRRHLGGEFVPTLQVSLAEFAFPVNFVAGAHAEHPPFYFGSAGQHFDDFADRRGLVWLGETHLTYVNLSVPLTD